VEGYRIRRSGHSGIIFAFSSLEIKVKMRHDWGNCRC
jgi:hypothetical protein